ncbi:MAG: hypothetical protein ACO3JL_21005, partial [Myxococcota bacterium]
NRDLDDDNDGFTDADEVAVGTDPLDDNSRPADLDGDFIPDLLDEDIDGDGRLNPVDAFPLNPGEADDTDEDGIGNNADPDDDNDQYTDGTELILGTDPRNASSIPADLDRDLIPDVFDDDRDGDTYKNEVDAFPDDSTRWEAVLPLESFAGGYQDLIPSDADTSLFEPQRLSVARGVVLDSQGLARSGIYVNAVNHPEFGTAVTDELGYWRLVLNGGQTYTLRFDDPLGSPSVDRNVSIPWNDIVVVPSLRMSTLDPVVTSGTLDGTAGDAVVHQSQNGVAPTTVVIPRDVKAFGRRYDGTRELLRDISLRATEYPDPDSMPASLPPSSLFTLCFELSIDEWDSVDFRDCVDDNADGTYQQSECESRFVNVWVPNFLEFDVGTSVPFGYYDRDLAAWNPQPDGVVVELLDSDQDTFVDALDASGDGQPDDLGCAGTFTSEG